MQLKQAFLLLTCCVVAALIAPAQTVCSPRLDSCLPLPFVVTPESVEENARYWLMLEMDMRPLESIALERGIPLPIPDPRILIHKSAFSLYYYSGDVRLKTYPMAVGKYAFEGPKFQEGDGRTPEGEYFVCRKLTQSSLANPLLGTRWMHISYPNERDAEVGFNIGLITEGEMVAIKSASQNGVMPPQATALGGGIGIHGGYFDDLAKSTKTWTGGCIGMRNRDIEEIYTHSPIGTPVSIVP